MRLGYGRGFRVPSIRERYHEFIDSNHNLIGNAELTPEYSHHFDVDLSQTLSDLGLKSSLSFFYNSIKDQITFFTPQTSNAPTTYLNRERFRSVGVAMRTDWQSQGWRITPGVTYIGRYQRLAEDVATVPDFIFQWEANAALSYSYSPSNTTISAFYKFNGSLQDYRLVESAEDDISTPILQGIESYHLLDVTINQSFNQILNLSLGVRNLLNVTTVNNNLGSGGAHSGTGGSTSVGYGRSIFFRVNYHFKTKH